MCLGKLDPTAAAHQRGACLATMTTMDRFTPSRAPVKRVKSVQMGVWDPEEIVRAMQRRAHAAAVPLSPSVTCSLRPTSAHALATTMSMPQKKYSVCHVEAAELFEKGKAKSGGLSDPRMGTMDKYGGVCTTDGAGVHDCPGYFGHIELAEPVYHCERSSAPSTDAC